MSLNPRPDTRPVVAKILPPLLVLFLVLASCGPDRLEGRVVVSGSATLSPLATQVVEGWKALHPRVESRVETIGSDAGLERLLRYRDADLALVSRPLSENDRDAARNAGLTLVVLPVARDAVSLVVPASNTWAQSLTREQTTLAFTSARLWSDLDPAWPSVAIHRFVLGPNSGTADVFADQVLGGDKAQLYTASEVQASEDDTIVARGVAQVPGALGFLGWSTLQGSKDSLRSVALDGVVPTKATIQDRTYGLPRTLWLVGTREGFSSNAAALALVHFLYDNYSTLTAETGLVPLSDLERSAAQSNLP